MKFAKSLDYTITFEVTNPPIQCSLYELKTVGVLDATSKSIIYKYFKPQPGGTLSFYFIPYGNCNNLIEGKITLYKSK
jgi:hypothetical protein